MELFRTYISDASVQLTAETLRQTWVSEGKAAAEFVSRLSDKLGIPRPVLVNSGTSALHLGLALANVGPGDEVILPAQTFFATGLAILMQHAKPVFADIDPSTGNISPQSIRPKVTAKTKAVMPVHWSGYPCDMDEINAIAREFKLTVVEDAAHALGARYKGKPIGAVSDFTAFSFQAIKHLTTGDGGAVSCLDPEQYERARRLRWFGIDRVKDRPGEDGERVYNLTEVGYKYHMNDVAACIGLGNLQDFPQRLKHRQKLGAAYREALKDVPGLTLLRKDSDRDHAYWMFTMLVDRRQDFIRKLGSKGIPASVVHQRIDRNQVFGGVTPDLPGQEEWHRRQVSIPLHEALSDDDVNLILSTVQSGW